MTELRLGDFVFKDFEVPEELEWGGVHLLTTHGLIGGRRVVDAMGPDEDPIRWEGEFYGEDAFDRCQRLHAMRKAGRTLELTCHKLAFRVQISNFRSRMRTTFKYRYMIECLVVEDLFDPAAPPEEPGVDAMLRTDSTRATQLGGLIGDAPLSGTLRTMDAAIRGVSNFAAATRETINTVLQPIADAKARVDTLIGQSSAVLTNFATLGGVVPFNPVAETVSRLTGQAAAAAALPDLYDLGAVLGRMGTNAVNATSSGRVITLAGGDLYRLAVEAYGDVNEWPTLARANGRTEPILTGVQQILVPPRGTGAGGVLKA